MASLWAPDVPTPPIVSNRREACQGFSLAIGFPPDHPAGDRTGAYDSECGAAVTRRPDHGRAARTNAPPATKVAAMGMSAYRVMEACSGDSRVMAPS